MNELELDLLDEFESYFDERSKDDPIWFLKANKELKPLCKIDLDALLLKKNDQKTEIKFDEPQMKLQKKVLTPELSAVLKMPYAVQTSMNNDDNSIDELFIK